MKSTFLFGFLLGLFGALVGGYFVPWANYDRVASKTRVAMNGGREESFVIRLPDDRIAATGIGVDSVDPVVGVAPPGELGGSTFLGEHFKLRDVDGTVIGVAARHWTQTGTGAATAWVLNIPSRGSLLLAASDAGPARIQQALAGAGHRVGSAWTGEAVVPLSDADAAPHVAAGTDEFADIEGHYDETWTVTGVDERGELRGTVLIRTTVKSRS